LQNRHYADAFSESEYSTFGGGYSLQMISCMYQNLESSQQSYFSELSAAIKKAVFIQRDS